MCIHIQFVLYCSCYPLKVRDQRAFFDNSKRLELLGQLVQVSNLRMANVSDSASLEGRYCRIVGYEVQKSSSDRGEMIIACCNFASEEEMQSVRRSYPCRVLPPKEKDVNDDELFPKKDSKPRTWVSADHVGDRFSNASMRAKLFAPVKQCDVRLPLTVLVLSIFSWRKQCWGLPSSFQSGLCLRERLLHLLKTACSLESPFLYNSFTGGAQRGLGQKKATDFWVAKNRSGQENVSFQLVKAWCEDKLPDGTRIRCRRALLQNEHVLGGLVELEERGTQTIDRSLLPADLRRALIVHAEEIASCGGDPEADPGDHGCEGDGYVRFDQFDCVPAGKCPLCDEDFAASPPQFSSRKHQNSTKKNFLPLAPLALDARAQQAWCDPSPGALKRFRKSLFDYVQERSDMEPGAAFNLNTVMISEEEGASRKLGVEGVPFQRVVTAEPGPCGLPRPDANDRPVGLLCGHAYERNDAFFTSSCVLMIICVNHMEEGYGMGSRTSTCWKHITITITIKSDAPNKLH